MSTEFAPDVAPPYRGLVVGVDLSRAEDESVAVARALAGDEWPIELVTVVPPGARRLQPRESLERLAGSAGLPSATCTVLESSRPGGALLESAGDTRLLVIGCAPGHPLRAPRLGDVGRAVLGDARKPVLIVGPATSPRFTAPSDLVVCAVGEPIMAAISATDRWTRTFRSSHTWVTGVIPTSTDVGGHGAASVGAWAGELRRLGHAPHERVLNGSDPVTWLEEFTRQLPSAVYVVASERYTDRRRHLGSTTRELIARSSHPLLVVPATSDRDHTHGFIPEEQPRRHAS